jgi:hypothetical protein
VVAAVGTQGLLALPFGSGHPSTDDQGDKEQDDEYDEQNFGYIGSRSGDPPKSEETCEQRDDQEGN